MWNLPRPLLKGGLTLALMLPCALFALQGLEAAPHAETITLDSEVLVVGNLIGEITIEGHRGSEFIVEVQVDGKDANDSILDIRTREGREGQVMVVFPEDINRYVYPKMGRSRSSFSVGNQGDKDRSWWRDLLGENRKIEVSGKGKGTEVWADILIRVPKGGSLRVQHGVGTARASQVEGNLSLDTRSGKVEVQDVRGKVHADTGSGSVMVANVEGNTNVDTGSGSVDVENINGQLRIDTGSGSVTVTGCQGDEINVDTGSGGVRVDGAVCKELRVDTGSGTIRASRVEADEVSLDTGSGGVDLALDRLGAGRVDIDTGSGSIELILPSSASAQVSASTGSGGIKVTHDDVEFQKKGRHSAEFTIGNGTTRVTLETGSGSIRVSG